MACFMQQGALISLGASLIILVICFARKRKIPLMLLIHFIIIAVTAVYMLYSFLTAARVTGGEEMALFPEFATFGLRDKIQLGIHMYDTHLLRSSSLLFLTLGLLAGGLAYKRLKQMHFCYKAIAFFPAFYILLNILPLRYLLSGTWNYQEHFADHYVTPTAFGYDPGDWFDFLNRVPPLGWGLEPKDLFMAVLAFACVILMIYPVYFAFKDKITGILASLLYLASFLSGIVIGFSPTVFASGSRPFLLSNILILLLCAMLVREGMTDEDRRLSDSFLGKTTGSKILIAIISLVSVYAIFMYKFIFASVYYWWY